MNLLDKFQKGIEQHTYQRIDPEYKVNFFLGYNEDGNMSMILTEYGNIEKVQSTKLIDVGIKRREDNKLALSFDLLDLAYVSMFTVFCKDMILVCERAGKEMAISNAIVRWKYWKEMFGKKPSTILDKQEIKGLIGELISLKELLIPKYGLNDAVKCWMGPMLGHKDFEINDTWYEIKTVNDGATQIHISSLEQLEADEEGHLIVVKLDDTPEKNEKAINLNSLIIQLTDLIEDPDVLDEFTTKLNNIGYVANSDYDSINFIYKGYDMYLVNEEFPRLSRQNINEAIGNVKYTIIMAGITAFKE